MESEGSDAEDELENEAKNEGILEDQASTFGK